MKRTSSITEIPFQPAVYAIYFCDKGDLSAAYVGSAATLREQLFRQLSSRKNLLSIRHSVEELKEGLSVEVRWWEHPDFANLPALEAAELIAFVTLNSLMSGTATISEEAKVFIVNELFREKMHELFNGEPSGVIALLDRDLNNLSN